MHTVSIYLAYFVQFLKQRLQYRWDFFTSVLSNILVTLSGLLFVVFLFDGEEVKQLGEWSHDEVLFIYGYSMMSMAIFSTFATNLYGFSNRYIVQGEFDRILLRPLNTLAQVLFESFNLEAVGSFCVGLSVMAYSAVRLEITFGVLDIAWILLSSMSGAVILLSVFIVLASFSFHFEDRIGIAPPFYNMIAFGRYPITIFNGWVKFFLHWIVPFAFIAFYPATHFLRETGFELYCYGTPGVALIAAFIAHSAWQFGVSRYTSTGS